MSAAAKPNTAGVPHSTKPGDASSAAAAPVVVPKWVRAPLQTISLRLAPGEVLQPVLYELAKQAGGRAYCIVTCVGSVRDISIRTANSITVLQLTEPHEITSLVGTFNAKSGHLHVTVSDRFGRCVGGHLMSGGTAFTTIELVIGEIAGVAFDRCPCALSGYDELAPTKVDGASGAGVTTGGGSAAAKDTKSSGGDSTAPLSAAASGAVDGMTAAQVIAHYKLDGHEEGGFYKRIYSSEFSLSKELPSSYGGVSRLAASAIFYMLTAGQVSKFHILKADEGWQFLLGEPITIVELDPTTKQLVSTVMGRDLLHGQKLFYAVKAGRWFGAYANSGTRYGLVSCTLTPEWHFEDFAFAKRSELIRDYPSVDRALIERLTDAEAHSADSAAAAKK